MRAWRGATRDLVLPVLLLGIISACSDPASSADSDAILITQPPPTAAVPGWPVHDTIAIRLVDGEGDGRAGVAVQWSVSKGDGTVVPLMSSTDAQGNARALWTLGPVPGINEMQFSGGGLSASLVTVGRAFQAERVDAGYALGCGLVNAALWCWGKDSWASSSPASDWPDPTGRVDAASPGLVNDTHALIDLAVSDNSVCALDSNGEVWCADADHRPLTEVAALPGLRVITRAPGPSPQFCGLAISDSTAWCWSRTSDPAAVASTSGLALLHVAVVAPGELYACGLHVNGAAVCWGPGPLGNGTTASSAAPVDVSGEARFVDLAVGAGFACGLTSSGEVWCWGKDWQNGSAGAPDVLVPTLALTGADQIAAYDDFAGAITDAGLVAWQGAGFDASPIPGLTEITGLDGLAVSGFAANSGSCLQLEDGQVYCWDAMWDASGSPSYARYTPVQPVSQGAP
jgi:hypothetical protein